MNENSPSPTINDWLRSASEQLAKVGIPSARLDAEILLAHTIRQPRTWLHAHGDESLEPRNLDIAQARLDLRLDRVPVAYIVGHKDFYGNRFRVTTATLIPRPESEALIDLLDDALRSHPGSTVGQRLVDVGTGSGNLGITAKLRHPELEVTLIDQSRYALSVAEKNANDHHAVVECLESDLLSNYPYVADYIIANLPYVDPTWERSPETRHEPETALFAEDHGLALIHELIAQTKTVLNTGGNLILEVDPTQHADIETTCQAAGLFLTRKQDYGLLFTKLK